MSVLWTDRKRIFGLPISFTKYILDHRRLQIITGFISLRTEEIALYRIKDFKVEINVLSRVLGVGDIIVKSADDSTPDFRIERVRKPTTVKELLYNAVQIDRKGHGVQATEFMTRG